MLYKSPLNYTGGKYKLLPQIMPYFPENIDTFVDLFCGGCNVGLNVDCNKVVYNDINPWVIGLYNTFKSMSKQEAFETIYHIIKEYGLSETDKFGNEYYGGNSEDGVSKYNSDKYLKLRNDFNQKKDLTNTDYKNLMFYVLLVYSFNNQIRFNSAGLFNMPYGKRDFNSEVKEKLSLFIDRIKNQNSVFSNLDFRELQNADWDDKTLVYVDPPYLITCATYNEKDGWNETLENELLKYLDSLHKRGIRFALSNVLKSKGRENKILIEWTKGNKDKYKVIPLVNNYSNCNYQRKDTGFDEEVLIINYEANSVYAPKNIFM